MFRTAQKWVGVAFSPINPNQVLLPLWTRSRQVSFRCFKSPDISQGYHSVRSWRISARIARNGYNNFSTHSSGCPISSSNGILIFIVRDGIKRCSNFFSGTGSIKLEAVFPLTTCESALSCTTLQIIITFATVNRIVTTTTFKNGIIMVATRNDVRPAIAQ